MPREAGDRWLRNVAATELHVRSPRHVLLILPCLYEVGDHAHEFVGVRHVRHMSGSMVAIGMATAASAGSAWSFSAGVRSDSAGTLSRIRRSSRGSNESSTALALRPDRSHDVLLVGANRRR